MPHGKKEWIEAGLLLLAFIAMMGVVDVVGKITELI